ncbi:MAG: hypothetical protein ABH891_10010 [Candidatus Omnitrophota bacterium]
MTLYEKLFDLKYRQGVPTCELAQRFPEHVDRVNEVALLDIPENTLKKVLPEKRILERVISLKKQFQGTNRAQRRRERTLD